MTVWLILAVFIILFALGAPVFISLGLVAALCITRISGSDPGILAQQMFTITDKQELLALPLFVFTSVLMTSGASAKKITDFIASLVEWLPGGLGLATVASCIFFAAVSGLSPAAIVAVGAIMFPALISAGYPERFSLGLVTSAGSLGILIPPSVVMIVLGVSVSSSIQSYNETLMLRAAQVGQMIPAAAPPPAAPPMDKKYEGVPPQFLYGKDYKVAPPIAPSAAQTPPPAAPTPASPDVVAGQGAPRPAAFTKVTFKNLFLAGAVPVAIIAAMFSLLAVVTGVRRRAARENLRPRRIASAFLGGLPALILPVLVIDLIFRTGLPIFHAAAVAAVYALLLETLIYRSLTIRGTIEIFRETGAIVGMILIIIAVTFAFNWFLTEEEILPIVTDFIRAHFHSPLAFLLAVNVLFLIMGCIMDILSAIFITIPLLLPAAMSLGVDPLQFSIMFIVNFEIGYLTPPVGIDLFTTGAIFKRGLSEVSRSVVPFVLLLLLALAAVTCFPPLSLWLVRLIGEK